jgi:hypothetical protein
VAPLPPAQPVRFTPTASLENVFGRKVLSIVAAILVFLGLGFIGVLVVPGLPDSAKMVLLLTISAAFLVAGLVLDRRYQNHFTRALLGTGLGAVFISILILHIYFHAFNDIIAFTLLLGWTAGTLVIAKYYNSLMTGIIAHAGMVLSVVIAYGSGISDDRLLLLIGYQLASTAVIVIGSTLFCQRTLRYGLFASLALMVFASLAMFRRFFLNTSLFSSYEPATQLPELAIAAAFAVQFIGASVLSVWIVRSLTQGKERQTGIALQILNLGLWLAQLLFAVTLSCKAILSSFVTRTANVFLTDCFQMIIATGISLVVLGLAALALLVANRRSKLDRLFTRVSVLILAAVATLYLFANYFYLQFSYTVVPELLLLVVLAMALYGARHLVGDLAYGIAAASLLCLDAAFMLRGGFAQLTSSFGQLAGVALSVIYLVCLLGLACACFHDLKPETRRQCRNSFFLTMLTAVYLSLIDILWIASLLDIGYQLSLITLGMALVAVAFGFWQRTKPFRIYGLVLTVISVLKLVTLDIIDADTLMRAVAFVGGGLVCFGISALYNFAVKRLADPSVK